jgi:tetratricopeptide (TPR) repeat protein
MRSWMLGLCFVLAATPALADDKAKAKQLYDEGLRHYQVAEYTQAIETWKQAYVLSKKPLLLFNIGQAYRLSGDCKTAQTFYDNYTEAEPNPKNQDELDQAVAACKNGGTTDASKPTDTKPAITTTVPPPTDTTTKPVDTTTKPVDTTPKPVDTTVKPVDTTPQPVESTISGGGRRRIGMIVGIAGVVLEGGAVFFALDGKSKASDAEKVSTWDEQAKALQTAGERDNKLAIGLGIAGGAAIVAGVVLFVTGGSSDEHGVAIAPTRDGAQVGWSTTF